jgi:ParB-like chromosome segregation protein Spo0J
LLGSMDDQKKKPNEAITVQLSEVDMRPGPCCMSFGFDLDPLVGSIAKVGLVNPPFLAKGDKGRMEVVAGYRRLIALKSLDWEKVHCRDMSHLSPLERLHLNFYENLGTRAFNHVEIGMVLRRLASHLSRQEIVENHLPLMGLPSHDSTLELYLAVDALEDPVKSALAAQTLSLRAAKALLGTDAETRLVLLEWISNLRLTFNQQIQLIDYAVDICTMENTGATVLFEEDRFASILEDPKANLPQKGKQVLELLRARRHPSLTKAEHIFQTRVARLRLPQGVTIKHPPFFEDPFYRLEIAFRNGKALTEKLKALYELEGLLKIGDPWAED